MLLGLAAPLMRRLLRRCCGGCCALCCSSFGALGSGPWAASGQDGALTGGPAFMKARRRAPQPRPQAAEQHAHMLQTSTNITAIFNSHLSYGQICRGGLARLQTPEAFIATDCSVLLPACGLLQWQHL